MITVDRDTLAQTGSDFILGVVRDLDVDTDLAKVDIIYYKSDGQYEIKETVENVPIKYTCKSRPEIRSNGSYKRSAFAFSPYDYVALYDDGNGLAIVANLSRKRVCMPKIIIYYHGLGLVECQYNPYTNQFGNFAFCYRKTQDFFMRMEEPAPIPIKNGTILTDITYDDYNFLPYLSGGYIPNERNYKQYYQYYEDWYVPRDINNLVAFDISVVCNGTKQSNLHYHTNLGLFANYSVKSAKFYEDKKMIGYHGLAAYIDDKTIPIDMSLLVTDGVIKYLESQGCTGSCLAGYYNDFYNVRVNKSDINVYIYNPSTGIFSPGFGGLAGYYLVEGKYIFGLYLSEYSPPVVLVDDNEEPIRSLPFFDNLNLVNTHVTYDDGYFYFTTGVKRYRYINYNGLDKNIGYRLSEYGSLTQTLPYISDTITKTYLGGHNKYSNGNIYNSSNTFLDGSSIVAESGRYKLKINNSCRNNETYTLSSYVPFQNDSYNGKRIIMHEMVQYRKVFFAYDYYDIDMVLGVRGENLFEYTNVKVYNKIHNSVYDLSSQFKDAFSKFLQRHNKSYASYNILDIHHYLV